MTKVQQQIMKYFNIFIFLKEYFYFILFCLFRS